MYEDQYADDYDYYADYDLHTGDPKRDLEHERQYLQFKVPETVRSFLIHFRLMVNTNNVKEIQNIYENTFPRFSEEYYKNVTWPSWKEVASYVENDEPFLILYQELYYRHIYARVSGGPTIEQRFESYYNYCKLFNLILSAETPIPIELPNQWMWEIIEEFIYQYQSFTQYRCKLSKKSAEEISYLRDNAKVWDVHSVLNVLHSLVDKSNINRQLEVYASGGNPDAIAGEFGRHSLYKMLGYFSLIGLLRLHSILGDYYMAIKVLDNIELNKKSHYSRVPACQITTYYYVGFAYMMMRRYADAIRTFSNILLYIQRTKQMFQTRTYQNDQINKQTDQMYTLLAICLVLHPQCIDESVNATLRESFYTEKMNKMQRGDLKEFENCFLFACPKFLSPVPPDYTMIMDDNHKESLHEQLKVFLEEVQQQHMVPTIRSYLKLYTTMPVAKMANFLKMNEDQFRTHLLCFKHKMKNMVWTKGTSGLEGEFQSGSEVDFYIDKDMLHIADTKVARRYGDFFIRQILRFEDLNKKLRELK